MKRLGGALFWLGAGMAAVAACGGRTSALDDAYDDDRPGTVGGTGQGGSRMGMAGRAGNRPVGGTAPVAGRGGNSTGGSGLAGFPNGGLGTGGVGPSGGATGQSGFDQGGFAAAGGLGPLGCQTCLTQACTPQVAQCFQDVGCVAIFACMISSGCAALECYSPMFCKSVIDQFGGPTETSLRQLLEVVSCAANSGCNCP